MKRKKVEFFDKVLKDAGKKSNLFGKNTLIDIEDDKPAKVYKPGEPVVVKGMNGMDFINHMKSQAQKEMATIPTLDDIKKTNPDIYDKYIRKAKHSQMVHFVPNHKLSDDYGFLSIKIKAAYKNLKRENIITLIGDKPGEIYEISNNSAMWIFNQNHRIYDKALSTNEGKNFTHNKEKYYKLSKEELNQLIDNKIMNDGGIDIAPKKPGMENLGNGLFSISF